MFRDKNIFLFYQRAINQYFYTVRNKYSNMDVKFSDTVEKTIVINGVEITVDGFIRANAYLRNNKESVFRHRKAVYKMMQAGLVERKKQEAVFGASGGILWIRDEEKCQDILDDILVDYHIYKIKYGCNVFDSLDSREHKNAKQKARDKLELLEKRNPDVEWTLETETKETIPESLSN